MERWIADLHDVQRCHPEKSPGVCLLAEINRDIYAALLDARDAGVRFLRRHADLLDGDAHQHLLISLIRRETMVKRSRLDILGEAIEQHAGEAIRRAVMQNWETATTPVTRARWMKAAIDRLDALTDEPTRAAVMAQSGRQCSWSGYAKKIAVAKKHAHNFDELLAGVTQFWHIEPGDGVIYLTYPHCYCSMVKATKEPISKTYCLCVQAFSVGLGRDVHVDIIHTIVQGADECRFAVHISPEQW